MDKVKILTVSTVGFKKREGISTIIFDYFSKLDKEKFELFLIVNGEYDKDWIYKFENIGIKTIFLPSRKKHMIKYIQILALQFKKNKFDVLYVHGSSSIMIIELIIAKIFKCKKRIVHCHNTTCSHKIADKLLRPLFYHCYTDALACGSEAGKWLYGNRKFKIIKNGRDIDKYKFNQKARKIIRNNLQLDENTLAIGHVGNFNQQKNQQFIIYVLKELVKLDSNIKLYLMGDGFNKKNIEKLVEKECLSNYVVFTGSINNIPDMLQAMDVMLLPSLYEGLPLVVVEWQINGLPIILSDTITKECVYTPNVYYLSLDDSYKKWASQILNIEKYDRTKASNENILLTNSNHLDLNSNIKILESIFIN